MTENGFLQIAFFLMFTLLLAKPLGWYMARVYSGKPCVLNQIGHFIEEGLYRLAGIQPKQGMNWKYYLSAMLIFNCLGIVVVYVIQRLQFYLPLNPQSFAGIPPYLAFNTAVSFASNTDWQAYGGENTMSYLTQMLALTVQNFFSAASGMSLLVAFIRGLVRHESLSLGNFWVDAVRSILYILLPLATILALLLCGLGVMQNFHPYQSATLLQPLAYTETVGHQTIHHTLTQQILPMGPVASQVAIKQLGTNGGGFFHTNAAHPFENPTPVTNFLEMLALWLIPAAFCYTFGLMVNDKRQGLALLLTMLFMLVPLIFATLMAEQPTPPAFTSLGIESRPQADYPAGNMEGKETRFGIVNSAMWATLTTATSNGSVNAMPDSFTPLGGLVPLWLMHLGEVIFGGVGSGLSGMLVLVIITVFIAGLMVGRTPEYLGKKIDAFEIKMACFAILVMPFTVLLLTALAVLSPAGNHAVSHPGAHGFTEILYTFTSMVNNNGSAFAGLQANIPFYNIIGGFAMLIGRYWIAIPILAIAGSLVKKKRVPSNLGTLSTHSLLFIFLLLGIIIILGALTFFPALALGPIVEHLMLGGKA